MPRVARPDSGLALLALTKAGQRQFAQDLASPARDGVRKHWNQRRLAGLTPAGWRLYFQGRPLTGCVWRLVFGPMRRRSNCSRHGELLVRP